MTLSKDIQNSYENVERLILRLWENVNVIEDACTISLQEVRKRNISNAFQFQNIRAPTFKPMTRMEELNSLKDIRGSHVWTWCLIVAISQFDAWIEDTVRHIHDARPHLRGEACLRGYRSTTPSFNLDFFKKDQSAIGIKFPKDASVVGEFVKWKEARNCLIHKGGRITERYAKCCNPKPKIGTKLILNDTQAREALAVILKLVNDIQQQLRKIYKRG